jgi:hypothetical protein
MNWKIRIMAMMFLLLPAVAGYAGSSDPVHYSGTYQSNDMSLSWNIQQQADALTIKGIAQNTFHYRIYQLQLYAVLLDDKGKPVGKEVAFLGPNTMDLDQKEPFTLTIPVSSSVSAKNIRLEYRFHLGTVPVWLWTYERTTIPLDGSS